MENMTQKIKNRTVFKSFVLFGGFLPIREFFTHRETSLLPDLYSAPNVIEQWGSLTQDIRLLWSFPRTSDTHMAERSTVELSLLVLTTWVCNNRDSNIQSSEWEANALIDCATAAIKKFYLKQHKIYHICHDTRILASARQLNGAGLSRPTEPLVDGNRKVYILITPKFFTKKSKLPHKCVNIYQEKIKKKYRKTCLEHSRW